MYEFKTDITDTARKTVDELKNDFKISDYEALHIAMLNEQNQILKRAFVISDLDKYPSALESIAASFGEQRPAKV